MRFIHELLARIDWLIDWLIDWESPQHHKSDLLYKVLVGRFDAFDY